MRAPNSLLFCARADAPRAARASGATSRLISAEGWYMTELGMEIKFTVPIGQVPEEHRIEAERKAREAFVLILLRHGDVSAGRAAEVLGVNRWKLGELMSTYGISPFDETLTREEPE